MITGSDNHHGRTLALDGLDKKVTTITQKLRLFLLTSQVIASSLIHNPHMYDVMPAFQLQSKKIPLASISHGPFPDVWIIKPLQHVEHGPLGFQ
jgi:hypothetical protein